MCPFRRPGRTWRRTPSCESGTLFVFSTPTDDDVRAILAGAAEVGFTHPYVGITREEVNEAPTGFRLDRYGTALGEGKVTFERACAALRTFGNYPDSFTRVLPLEPEVREGLVFGTIASHFGFASVHPCLVAYVIDEMSAGRFGFGLGTLPGHAGSGEERFLVSMNPETGVVRYDVQAISRPQGFLMQLGRPVMRFVQGRFQRDTCAAMVARAAGR